MDEQDKKEVEQEWEAPRRKIRPAVLILIAVCVLVLGGVLYFLLRRNPTYTKAELLGSTELAASGSTEYTRFAGGILRWSRDGVSLVSQEGKEQWNISYTMDNPHLFVQGEYGAVADLLANNVVVFGAGGLSGRYTTTSPILTLAVSAHGVTAAALDNGLNSTIQFYDREGRKLDILVSLEMALSGYPLALALSADGNGLAASMAGSSSGALNSQLVFYNFSVGKSETNRLIGYFIFEKQLLPQVDYLTDRRVAAVSDERIDLFSLDQANKPERLKTIEFPGRITRYAAGEEHLAVLCPDQSTGQMMLRVYDANGEPCFEKGVEGSIRRLELYADRVLLVTDQGIGIWYYSGKTCFSGKLEHNSAGLFLQGSRLVQFDGTRLYRYQLK